MGRVCSVAPSAAEMQMRIIFIYDMLTGANRNLLDTLLHTTE